MNVDEVVIRVSLGSYKQRSVGHLSSVMSVYSQIICRKMLKHVINRSQ